MRAIKFRAFYEGSMHRVLIADWFSENVLIDLNGELTEISFEKVTPERYTGVDDADGGPIYEGDILQDLTDGYVVGKVEYDCGAFNCAGYNMYDASDYKVIGNIHMNPELLEAK